MFSIYRIFNITIVATLALSFWNVVAPIMFKSKWFNLWSDFYLNLSDVNQCVVFFITGLIINKILLLTGDYNENQEFQGIMVRFYYPPIRYAIIFLIFIYTIPYITKSNHLGLIFLLDQKFQLLLLFIGLSWGFLRNISKKTIELFKISIDKDKNNFLNWLLHENAIHNTEEDKFNREFIVERIVNRLERNESNILRGQTIVGEFGSGKSSVINLVEKKLLERRGWIICHFDSWGRINDGTQGQKLILEKIIEEISFYTGVSSVQSIPKDYINALNGLGNWWKNIMAVLYKTDLNPDFQLEKIEFILNAMNKKLLVFIEDIDRNSDSEKLAKSISPLLDRLVSVSNIHFIFTIGYEEHISSVITRITNYREDLFIDDTLIDQLLSDFRKECLLSSGSIFYFDGSNSLFNWPLKDGMFIENENCSISVGLLSQPAYEAIKHYAINPRNAKYFLRQVYESWSNNLAGEVNFDDLLIMNILKHSEPVVYEFIILNIDLLNKRNNGDAQKILMQKWDDIINKVNSTHHSSNLIKYLFNTKFNCEKESHTSGRNYKNMCIQSIASDNNRNKYFDIIVSNHISQNIISDNKTIEDLFYIFNSTSNTIIELEFQNISEKFIPIINSSYLNTCIKFSGSIPEEKRWIVFTFLAGYTRDILTNNKHNNLDWYIYLDLMKTSLLSISLSTENHLDISEEMFIFLTLPLIKNNIKRVTNSLITYTENCPYENIDIIKDYLVKSFFNIHSDISSLPENNITPNDFARFISQVYLGRNEVSKRCYSLLTNTLLIKPEITVLYISSFLVIFNLDNEIIKYFTHSKRINNINNIFLEVESLNITDDNYIKAKKTITNLMQKREKKSNALAFYNNTLSPNT